MNNKKIGNEFEHEMCEKLASAGYWVHFITPDARGAQPFDIIAVKAGQVLAIDCKTCVAGSFSMSRLENNQIMAFDKWVACGNESPLIAVKHAGGIYIIPYNRLKCLKNVKLTGEFLKDAF